jgi:hypothetical protein
MFTRPCDITSQKKAIFTAMENLRDQQFKGILEQSIKNLGDEVTK